MQASTKKIEVGDVVKLNSDGNRGERLMTVTKVTDTHVHVKWVREKEGDVQSLEAPPACFIVIANAQDRGELDELFEKQRQSARRDRKRHSEELDADLASDTRSSSSAFGGRERPAPAKLPVAGDGTEQGNVNAPASSRGPDVAATTANINGGPDADLTAEQKARTPKVTASDKAAAKAEVADATGKK